MSLAKKRSEKASLSLLGAWIRNWGQKRLRKDLARSLSSARLTRSPAERARVIERVELCFERLDLTNIQTALAIFERPRRVSRQFDLSMLGEDVKLAIVRGARKQELKAMAAFELRLQEIGYLLEGPGVEGLLEKIDFFKTLAEADEISEGLDKGAACKRPACRI